MLLSAAIVALLATWLYRRALSFAYFNDDPTGHFAWMEGRSLLQIFSGSAEYGYYRPVVFAVLRLFEVLFGNDAIPHNPVADHALLLLLHGVNTALVWAMARRLSGHESFAWVASLTFAFLPFGYEAVAYVASLTHPLLVLWVLLALLLYDHALSTAPQQPPPTRYLLPALVAMILGLLTHESGLFIFPALVGLDWVRRPGATFRERLSRIWLFAVPPVLFALLWLLIPKNSAQSLNGLSDISRNIVPFLQTLLYPLLPLLRLDTDDVWLLVVLATGVTVLIGILARRAGFVRLWAFALGWFGLSILPALLFLGPSYVYGSPRLSYLPSIAVALLWAIPMLWLKHRISSKKPGLYQATAAVYTLALILPPLPFINCQLDFYAETSHFAREMARVASASPPESEVVLVNAPFFFSSTGTRPDGCPSPYPWTPTGGILVPPYARVRDFVRFNGGPDRAVTGVTYAGYAPGWRTFGPEIDDEALRHHAASDATFVFDLLSGSFNCLPGVWQPDAGASESPLASFGNALQLVEAKLLDEGRELAVQLDWQVETIPNFPIAAFVHVYDAAGTLVAQSDGPPGRGFVPQALWRPGDGLSDEHHVELPPLAPGSYTVAVGLYNATDGQRLAAMVLEQPLVDQIFKVGTIVR